MGRPKASAEQQVFARDKFYGGLMPKAILIEIEKEFDEPVSLRTVERWIRGFRKSETPEDKLMNSPFELHRLGEYGLPWESGEYLADMCYWLGEYRPTSRDAVWWWRVHLMAQDLTYLQVWRVAHTYSVREYMLKLGGGKMTGFRFIDYSDMDSFLTYKPWRSQGRLDNYKEAIKDRSINPLTDMGTTSFYKLFFTRKQIDPLNYLLDKTRRRDRRSR